MNRDGPYETPSGPTAYRNLLILLRPHSVNYFSFQRHGRLQHETQIEYMTTHDGISSAPFRLKVS